MQPGDVTTTYADTTALEHDFAFTPKIKLREGLRKFTEFYHFLMAKTTKHPSQVAAKRQISWTSQAAEPSAQIAYAIKSV